MARLLIKRAQPDISTQGDFCYIDVGHGKKAIVDPDDYLRLCRYRWRLQRSHHCWYAVRKVVRNGRYIYTRMHREIIDCPKGWHIHHINHNTLDNRKCNLLAIDPENHKKIHTLDRNCFNFFINIRALPK